MTAPDDAEVRRRLRVYRNRLLDRANRASLYPESEQTAALLYKIADELAAVNWEHDEPDCLAIT